MGTPGLQECKYMRNSCTHFTPGVPNLPLQTLPYNSALLDGQVETSDIADFFPRLFHIQLFEFSLMPSTKGRILKNQGFSNIQLFEFSLMVNTKSRILKSRRFSNSQSRSSHAFCSACCDS